MGYSKKWLDETYEVWKVLQNELVKLSHQGKQLIAEKSDHLVPRHQPELIVEAVREIIEMNKN